MRLEPLGESAFLIRELGEREAFALAELIQSAGLPGVLETTAAYETVGVFCDTASLSLQALEAFLDGVESSLLPAVEPQFHIIPVCYELGDDWMATAESLALTGDELAAYHTSIEYRCYAIGFSPGFPFLGYLPKPLCGVHRRPQPRPRVASGSVGLTGKQTGIYPSESPGGWALIGRTPLTIIDLEDEYFPIRAGDWIRFERIAPGEFGRLKGKRL